jgi:hypothetical protein
MGISVGTKDFEIPKSEKRSELYYGIQENQDWKCKWCDRSIASGGQIHHKDGNCNNYRTSNLIALCEHCYDEAKQINDDNSSYLGILFR